MKFVQEKDCEEEEERRRQVRGDELTNALGNKFALKLYKNILNDPFTMTSTRPGQTQKIHLDVDPGSRPSTSQESPLQGTYATKGPHVDDEPSLANKNELDETTAAMTALTIDDFDWLDDDGLNGTGMWVFGYGSLCWHQGFAYDRSVTGFIRGFSRKFWQGNTTHRGTENKPGRVATLIQDEEGTVWGQAFQVKEKEAFSYLFNRECELGGYLTTISTFYPRQGGRGDKMVKPFPVILYLATPSNRYWLGDSSLTDIANQIVESAGNSGHNVEYLLRLAEFIRENVPEAIDEHLFTLEHLVRLEIEERNLCLETLMGENKSKRFDDSEGSVDEGRGEPDAPPAAGVRQGRRDALQFTSTVSPKKLRCVNIC